MTLQELREQLVNDTDNLNSVLAELDDVYAEAQRGPITPAVRNGGASLIAQCYSGIESILKRIAKYKSDSLPSGHDWHATLLIMFKINSGGFIDEKLFEQLALMRRFRHVVHHGYGFKLSWESIQTAMKESREIVEDFVAAANRYVDSIDIR